MLENIIRFSRADGAKSPYLTFLNSPATTVSLMCRHTAAIGVFSMPSTQKRCFYKARKKVSILKPLTGHLQILRTDRRKEFIAFVVACQITFAYNKTTPIQCQYYQQTGSNGHGHRGGGGRSRGVIIAVHQKGRLLVV